MRFLPLMDLAWRAFDLRGFDLVISSNHASAKNVRVPAGVPHVCYCHTPMRYAWHLRAAYFRGRGPKQWLIDRILSNLREWDRRTAAGVTHFLANSRVVQRRIRDCYGRDSTVIYPPVDTNFYCPADVPREDYYLILSAFAPYKRLDLAIKACNRLSRPLVIMGKGQAEKRLLALAGPEVAFLGWQPYEVVRHHVRRCRALLFPADEDFGIVPVEAQACGARVIAFGQGGATESVMPLVESAAPTGVWFEEQNTECLTAAIEQFERERATFDPRVLRQNALRFRAQRFEDEIVGFVRRVVVDGESKPLAA